MRNLEQEYKENIQNELNDMCKSKNIVIWGAGSYGYNIFKIFKKYDFGKYVVAFCDNCESKWNTTIENLEILSYEQIKQKYKNNVIFLICSTWEQEIKKQLIDLGESNNIHIPSIYLIEQFQGNSLIPMYNMWNKCDKEKFDRLIKDTSEILKDEESKEVLFARVNLIKNADWKYLDSIDISKPQYFLNDFYELTDEEIYVDLGAYNGDTILKFTNSVQGNYKKIIAFEPAKESYNYLKDNIEKYNLKNVNTYNLGSWNKKTTIGFISDSNSNKSGSHISENEENQIYVDSLDNLFIDIPITFIKMDIEGAEKETLWGAKQIIKKYKPKLAVCVYHKWEDIYEIPKIMKNLVPEYKIYLRHHSNNLWETVCYACI